MKSKAYYNLLLTVSAVLLSVAAANVAAQSGETLSRVHFRWHQFIESNFQAGMTASDFLAKIDGRYITSGKVFLGGSGAYELVVRIDDFTHLVADFDGQGVLLNTPRIAPASKFMRYPDGSIELIK